MTFSHFINVIINAFITNIPKFAIVLYRILFAVQYVADVFKVSEYILNLFVEVSKSFNELSFLLFIYRNAACCILLSF